MKQKKIIIILLILIITNSKLFLALNQSPPHKLKRFDIMIIKCGGLLDYNCFVMTAMEEKGLHIRVAAVAKKKYIRKL